ncbi:uncharacterized protein K452DRAFT_319490 [Aplosporella prunicola CBS 121167]|uniref:4-coumarate-CoA ligase n=1 Tax=Aplosporella prunicola CBS 121167 TaxID=1176127 RepID=A0A6A6B8L4_9PEZI|nr:uncharacterized protein K452DRAFT_319490 [Aplosporella prunicola CBS 121167]KAF2140572.1 hypothetical protein K452DRAFT_319490 [Aplosporella prunicola CBS 121167]
MPVQSRWRCQIPDVDLPTYVFQSPTTPLATKPAIIDAAKPDAYHLTFTSYRLWAQRLAAGLQRAGLQPGDRVLLFSGNTIFFPVVVLGVIMAGGVFTGANPSYVPRELAYQLQDSGARFLICAEASLETGLEAARSVGLAEDSVFVFDAGGYATMDGTGKAAAGGRVRHWSALLAGEEEGRSFAWERLTTRAQLDRTIALNYSSGTTGVPKGVEITHRNYVANTEQTMHVWRLDVNYETKTKREKLLCFLPLYHAMGQTIFCVAAPMRQIPVYLMQKFDFIKMLEYTHKFRITDLTLVPPVVVAMAKHPATKQFDLSCVERVVSGAAPLSREVCAELEKLWPEGQVNIKQGWGMTEATCTVTGYHPNAYSDSHSVGELAPNCEAMIVDDNGQELPREEAGELWIRAPNIMKGYWRKPGPTAETLTADGWLKTGDIARINKAGFFFIVDRKKELIKVKGNQVAPAELEFLLLEHPGIADVAVIGVTIKGEELPRAYVVRKEGRSVTADEVHEFLNKKVSRTKRLVGGIRFCDVIPKNPSGKILRKALKEQAQKEIAEEERPRAKL